MNKFTKTEIKNLHRIVDVINKSKKMKDSGKVKSKIKDANFDLHKVPKNDLYYEQLHYHDTFYERNGEKDLKKYIEDVKKYIKDYEDIYDKLTEHLSKDYDKVKDDLEKVIDLVEEGVDDAKEGIKYGEKDDKELFYELKDDLTDYLKTLKALYDELDELE